MNIVICKGQLLGPISGADETLVTYATHLQAAGHNVSVLLMHRYSPEDHYYLRLLEAGVPVSCAASGLVSASIGATRKVIHRLFRAVPASKQLIRPRALSANLSLARRHYEPCRALLAGSGADVIHVITPDPSAMVMIRVGHDAGIPVLYQELGTPYHPPGFESYYERFTSVLPLCSEVAALSPKLAEHCRQRLPHAPPLSVLPIMSDAPPPGARTSPRRLTV